MTRTILSAILLAAITVGASQAKPQPPVSADGNSTVQPSLPSAQSPTGQMPGTLPPLGMIHRMQAEASWGMSVIPLPEYLRQQSWGLPVGQGWLVTQVTPGLPAANAGIIVGSTIVEINQTPVTNTMQLPMLQGKHKLLILNNSGFSETCVELMDNQLPADLINSELSQWINSSAVNRAFTIPSTPLGASALATANSIGFGNNSVALSEVSGQIVLSAVVETATGPSKVELRGSRADILRQLAALPADVQSQLAGRIGL